MQYQDEVTNDVLQLVVQYRDTNSAEKRQSYYFSYVILKAPTYFYINNVDQSDFFQFEIILHVL